MIRDGLGALQARDRAVENWLRNEMVQAYDEYKADPTQAMSLDEVRVNLAELHERTIARGRQ